MNRFATLAAFVPLVAAHGFIKSPHPRHPGDAFKAACGDQPFYQQSSDINGNVQGIMQVVGNSFDAAACNLWLCKGFQFDDNKANVQSYSLGEKIDFEITIAAPHTGIANVSVVKTSSNSIIGTPLIEFENYAANSGVAANNSAFSVTLPSNLDGECTTAGDCVLQWFWDAHDINQTYESCVDFTVSGSGSGNTPSQPPANGTPAPAPSSASATAAASSAASSAAPAPTSATEVVTSAITPAPSSTPKPEDPADDECPADDEDEGDDGEEDECPADEDEPEQPIENPVEDGDDDECPADEEEPEEGDDDECPADEEEGDSPEEGNAPAPAPTLSNKDVEPTPKPEAPKPETPKPETPKPETPKPETPKPQPQPQPNKPEGPRTTFSTVTREVTVTKEGPTVTVTAPAAGECTSA